MHMACNWFTIHGSKQSNTHDGFTLYGVGISVLGSRCNREGPSFLLLRARSVVVYFQQPLTLVHHHM